MNSASQSAGPGLQTFYNASANFFIFLMGSPRLALAQAIRNHPQFDDVKAVEVAGKILASPETGIPKLEKHELLYVYALIEITVKGLKTEPGDALTDLIRYAQGDTYRDIVGNTGWIINFSENFKLALSKLLKAHLPKEFEVMEGVLKGL